jgi:hypothetical protein
MVSLPRFDSFLLPLDLLAPDGPFAKQTQSMLKSCFGYVSNYAHQGGNNCFFITTAVGLDRVEIKTTVKHVNDISIGDTVHLLNHGDCTSRGRAPTTIIPTPISHCCCGIFPSSPLLQTLNKPAYYYEDYVCEEEVKGCTCNRSSPANEWLHGHSLSLSSSRFQIYQEYATFSYIQDVGQRFFTLDQPFELTSYKYKIDIRWVDYLGYFHPFTPLYELGEIMYFNDTISERLFQKKLNVVATIDHGLMTVELWSVGKWNLSSLDPTEADRRPFWDRWVFHGKL